MRQKVEFERERNNSLNSIAIVLLLIISFFIGFKQLNYAFLLLQITAILCVLVSEKKIDRHQQMMPVVALLCIIIIICNRNARLLHGSFSFLLDLRICTGFLIYFFICKRNNWYNALIKALIVLGVFYSVTTIYLYLFPDVYYRYVVPIFGNGMVNLVKRGYAVGFSRHHSTTAMYHAITIGIPACALVRRDYVNGKKKIIMILFVTILYIGVLLTGKRAHSIFIPICIMVCYYFFSQNRKINTQAKILGGILLFLGIFYISIQLIPSLNNVFIRFQSKIENDDITSGRDKLLKDCLYLFSDNPVIGKGWGTFMYYTQSGMENAHNVYAQLIAENGLLAIPFFVFIFGSVCHTGKAIHIIVDEKIEHDKSFLICLIFSLYIQVFFVLYCFTGNPLYDCQVVFPYILGCAIGENAYRITINKKQSLTKPTLWKYIKDAG